MAASGQIHAASSAAARPAAGASGALAPFAHGASTRSKRPPAVPVKLVDINSASPAELKTLPGIADAEVDRIIAGRPFLTKAELVTRKVIATGPYLSLKDRVIAMQKTKPQAKP